MGQQLTTTAVWNGKVVLELSSTRHRTAPWHKSLPIFLSLPQCICCCCHLICANKTTLWAVIQPEAMHWNSEDRWLRINSHDGNLKNNNKIKHTFRTSLKHGYASKMFTGRSSSLITPTSMKARLTSNSRSKIWATLWFGFALGLLYILLKVL